MTRLQRAILVVLDGVGVGANPDAHAYGDDGGQHEPPLPAEEELEVIAEFKRTSFHK